MMGTRLNESGVRDNVFFPPSCGGWACPDCGPPRAYQVAMKYGAACEAALAAHPGWKARMIVLTFDPSRLSPQEAWVTLAERRNEFLTSLHRDFAPFEYYWAVHLQRKQGHYYPHLHLVILGERYLPWQKLGQFWERTDYGAGRCKVSLVRSPTKALSRYLLKLTTLVAADLARNRHYASVGLRAYFPPDEKLVSDYEYAWVPGDEEYARRVAERLAMDDGQLVPPPRRD